jgi:hypothetical protein
MQWLPTGPFGRGGVALTVVLSHFPELELELELLRFSYTIDLMRDEMEVF